MARSELRDPLDKYRWIISIGDFTRAGFTSCNTPSFRATTHSYKEGGAHLSPRQILDSIDYQPVTFSRGVTTDTSFNKWATGHFDLVQNGQGANISTELESTLNDLGVPTTGVAGDIAQNAGLLGPTPVATNNPGLQYRREVKIKHVNRVGQTIVEYILHGAWPIEYKPASDFDSEDDQGFSIETITLAYDSFDVRYTGLAGALTSLGANSLF